MHPIGDNLGNLLAGRMASDEPALIDLRSTGELRKFPARRLLERSSAIARHLCDKGAVAGDRVAILARNSAEFVSCHLGILRAGLVSLPYDPRAGAQRIGAVLRDAGARYAFVDDTTALLKFEGVECFDIGADYTSASFEIVSVTADQAAVLMYTSGSTGVPNGVILSHLGQVLAFESFGNSLASLRGGRFLLAAPLYHMNGLNTCLVSLYAGMTVFMLPRFEPRCYASAIHEFSPTFLVGVPAMFEMLLRDPATLQNVNTESVRAITLGSALVTDRLLARVRAAFPNASVVNAYGATELGGAIFGEHPLGLARPPSSIGHPMPPMRVRLSGTMDIAQGILEVNGPYLFSGYWNRPELTAARLRDGWFDTRDVVRVDEHGFYYFMGRADDMFKCGGEAIFPSELEAILSRHPDIAQCCVVPASDPVKGQVPVAFVVPRSSNVLDEAAVKSFALANGPPNLHPRVVHIVHELPSIGPGKIDRRSLERRVRGETNS